MLTAFCLTFGFAVGFVDAPPAIAEIPLSTPAVQDEPARAEIPEGPPSLLVEFLQRSGPYDEKDAKYVQGLCTDILPILQKLETDGRKIKEEDGFSERAKTFVSVVPTFIHLKLLEKSVELSSRRMKFLDEVSTMDAYYSRYKYRVVWGGRDGWVIREIRD